MTVACDPLRAPAISVEIRKATPDQIGPAASASAPLVLASDSWEARLVRKARLLHALGKPVILLVKLGDCVPNWLKTVPDGR
jgi:hypothetical protein